MSVPPVSPAGPGLRVQVLAEAEAGLMKTVGVARAADPAAPASVSMPPEPLQQAVAKATATAVVIQSSAAPLFAELPDASHNPALPPAVREAAARVLALRLPTDGPLSGEIVRQAVAQSGLFLEANLAAGSKDAPPPMDLKAALLILRQALGPAPSRQPLGPKAAAAVPPPAPGAMLTGQGSAPSARPADADAVLSLLRQEADHAIARQTLHQAASLPDAAGAAWMFELPLVTPEGTAIAQFEIERDGHGAGGDPSARTWRARFSLDLEPLGPVHVHLAMGTGRSAVTLWAEREATADHLLHDSGQLAGELEAEVAVHPGAPRAAVPPAGRFVDRAS